MLSQDAKILIVDDMRLVRSAIKNYLTSMGYSNLIEAENGAEAVSKLKDNDVDLVFMDIVMPIMTGIDALKKIREDECDVPVVMLSSIADEKTIEDCKFYGVLDYILKPINATSGPDILKKALQKAHAASGGH